MSTPNSAPSALQLAQGEAVLWTGRVTWLSQIPMIGLGVLLLFLFPLGLIPFAIVLMRIYTSEYAITNRRVYAKYGIIRRRVADVPLENITDAAIVQQFWGRLLDYGHVKVNTAGASSFEADLKFVEDPVSVRGRVDSARTALAQRVRAADRLGRLEDELLTGRITQEQYDRAAQRVQGSHLITGP